MKTKLNFSISELIYSDTAIRNNINNMPDIKSLDCMLDIIYYCLQPLRNLVDKPIIITSGYRNYQVNKLVGGAIDKNGLPISQHCKGQAVDFIINGLIPDEIIKIIRKYNFEYDQLINEYDKWVHWSFVRNKNRKQYFKIEN